MDQRVGLVGIGLVGTALAERLRAAGYDVVGYDLDPARCEALAALGGEPVDSPAAVAEQAERVLLALMDSRVVQEVVEGERGLLTARARPQVLLDTSTGDPVQTAALAARLAARGVDYLDATISGHSGQIRAGTALFMVGGPAPTLARCRDLFAALTDRVVPVGPCGSGARAKLAVNLVLGLNRAALAEGLAFAEQLGLDPETILTLLRQSAAQSAVMETKGEKMVRGDFTPDARLRQHAKDVALIVENAARVGQDLPLSRAHLELLRQAVEHGDGDLDNAAVLQELRRRRR